MRYLYDLRGYLIRFGIVGISGILVNEGMLALFHKYLDWPLGISGALAIEISILSNFFLNNSWTWRHARGHRFLTRLMRYHSVAIISGLVNYGILLILSGFGMEPLIANLVGIATGTVINFFLNHYWTFARKTVSESDEARIDAGETP
jgi:dolichol-phosphate mannosyltransferase